MHPHLENHVSGHNHTGNMYVHDWYKCVSSGRPVSRLRVEPWNYPPISESCYNYPHQLPPPSMRPPVSLCCSFVLSHVGIVTMTWPYIITMTFRDSKNLDPASLHFFTDENCESSNTFTFLFFLHSWKWDFRIAGIPLLHCFISNR